MNRIQGFFATPSIPEWDTVTDHALIGWAYGDAKVLKNDMTDETRAKLTARLFAIREELWSRIQAFGAVDPMKEPEARKKLRRAWFAVCNVIGTHPEEE